MHIGISLATSVPRIAAGAPITPPPPNVNTDPGVASIAAEGWRASYTDPGSFDPVNDPRLVTVRRAGHDATGAAATISEDLVITSRVRQPFPDETVMSTDGVALSDIIYAEDTVPGVPNGSTRNYPLPQAIWLTHDLDVARSTTFPARLAVAHAHARQGRPVAAVKFIATDGTNSVESVVTGMDIITYGASGLSVPHFCADLDLGVLQSGVVVTIDAVIYPWVGHPFTLSADADPYPSANLSVLKVLNDHDDSYGTVYAYVDAAAGSNTTGQVSTDEAVALAAPFATVAAAAAEVQSVNTAAFGRASASGGIIRLQPGTHTHANFSSVAVSDVPLIVEAADPAQKAATLYQDAGSSISNGCPDKLKLRNLTLSRNSGGNVIFLDNSASSGSENMLITEGCVWSDNGFGKPWGAWLYRTGRFWNIDCGGDDVAQCTLFSTVNKAPISIGSGNGSMQNLTFHAVGCKDLNTRLADKPTGGSMQTVTGDFFGWCHMAQGTNAVKAFNVARTIGPRGLALVGTVVEQFGGSMGAAVSISADGVTTPVENVTLMLNTVVGSRTNLFYQDIGAATVIKEGRCRFNVDTFWNSKDDTLPPGNGARVGNWQIQYRAGFRGNTVLAGANNGSDIPGPGNNWLGEIAALDDVFGPAATPIDPVWSDDQSFAAAGTGDGIYRPTTPGVLSQIPAGLAPFAFDQAGQAIADDGSAVAGAIQP